MRTASRRLTIGLLLAVALVTAACSGGGASGGGTDIGAGTGETFLQFNGAAKLHMGGTLAMPPNPPKGPIPAVLIVPTPLARNDRNGSLDTAPVDPVYQDLSKAIAGAGLAAFRYDRRGMGVSKLDAGQSASFDDQVADAREALDFLSQRSGIDPSGLAVVGHDVGGVIAMKLAATDPRIRSVVLLSTPGRPLVDVMADSFKADYGQESADAFRSVIATLLATGSLPDRGTIRPEQQTFLVSGQDALLKGAFSLNPVAEATSVKVPTLLATGSQSTVVTGADATLLAKVLPSAQAFSADATATMQHIATALPQSFDPNDHRAHGGGRPADTAERDQPAFDRIAAFLSAKAGGPRQ